MVEVNGKRIPGLLQLYSKWHIYNTLVNIYRYKSSQWYQSMIQLIWVWAHGQDAHHRPRMLPRSDRIAAKRHCDGRGEQQP